MGLVTSILTLPMAPVRGTAWVLDQVLLAAEREYYDPARVRAQLAALVDDLENSRIDAEEFDRLEDELLDRLDEIEAYRRGRGNGS
ncbi:MULTISPECIES: gas vesicle protein GvpG [Streptomyces]|uniref:Gas vesicle protein GvpG n=1 Tax=Streptomyces lateritius TaxID=67313 RepID=A0ABW6YJ30_9ACTN|nr:MULTISPECIES: gas vesicle protein GvpG [Streptomyces]QGZ52353.1 gas vesicle protein [Streptomyces sp. QHH-9511]GGT85851.1 gas vesicle protein [Streptomyces lateritius]